MDKFTVLEGVAAPLRQINVDTDMIIPKDYLKTIKRTGLGKGLFAEHRFKDKEGTVENPDFILNKPAYRNTKILVAGDNFGCGSSREHAPWALTSYGFRAVISTSFADIFRSNSLKNGLIPIIVDETTHKMLFDYVEEVPNAEFTVDLETQTLSFPNGSVTFPIDPFNKTCLLNGVDELGYIMNFEKDIAEFEAKLT